MAVLQMNKDLLPSIIQFFVQEAEREHHPLGATRLVKFLYLLDVEHFKLYRSRVTELDWRFLHFGPYTPELERLLGDAALKVEEVPLPGGKVIRQIKQFVQQEVPSLPWEVERLVKHIFKDWIDKDLSILLNYVYFETEPMLHADKGDRLSFDSITPWKADVEVRVDPAKLRAIRHKLREQLREKPIQREPLTEIQGLGEIVSQWDPQTLPPVIDGEVKVDLTKRIDETPDTND